MRIYALVDYRSKEYATILGCLEQLREQFKDVVPVTWTIEYRDLSFLPWGQYNLGSDQGVSFNKISKDAQAIWEKHGYLYDTVVYFIDEAHWHANDLHGNGEPRILGWNLGAFFSNYQVQLLATNDVLGNMNYRINEEVAHSIDDFAFRELGRNIDAELGLDYDEDVVHDRNNPEGVRGSYREFYLRHPTLIQDIIKKRMEKAIAGLLTKIGVLIRDMLMRIGRAPKPTYEEHKH